MSGSRDFSLRQIPYPFSSILKSRTMWPKLPSLLLTGPVTWSPHSNTSSPTFFFLCFHHCLTNFDCCKTGSVDQAGFALNPLSISSSPCWVWDLTMMEERLPKSIKPDASFITKKEKERITVGHTKLISWS